MIPLFVIAAAVLTCSLAVAAVTAWCMAGQPVLPPYERTHR